ncbi:hypothetical protein [Maricaulis sp.]|uniref:hypothetical protein n=1 Tax=Maricaulis sp. TaxID=1486257 RepID=UPI00262241A0|nr:hypothetical protein [Maricaulis sp.]
MTRHDRNQYLLSAAALGMSALAMFFAFMEMRSSDRQFDASVWPYVDLTISLREDLMALDVANKGMGPAFIHEFRLSHPEHGEIEPLELMELSGTRELMSSSSTTSLTQSVMSVGDIVNAFRFEGEGIGPGMATLIRDLQIDICYCAINGACWNNSATTSFRTPVAQCSLQESDADRALDAFGGDAGETGDTP